jgi:membrane fusion protein (multidrug efflux system)
MKTMKYVLLILGLAAAGLLVVSCGSNENGQQTERVVAAKAIVARTADKEVTKTFTGSLEGERQAVLYAKLGEAVEKVHVREGQAVTTDQVLISLDKNGPTTRYSEALSLYKNAEKNYQKMEVLYKQGAVSESQYDAAKTQYEVSKAGYDAVSKLVDIQSPIDGVVTSVRVSSGDQVQLGQQLATVATTDHLRVKFAVNSDDVGAVRKGSKVTISSEYSPETADGEVTSVAQSADPTTRAFQVEALLDNKDRQFKPGMFVKIRAIAEKLSSVISVPRAAVLELNNGLAVFVAANGVAQKRSVTLGPDLEGEVVVQSGINPGDTVITMGQNYLDDGFKVNLTSIDEGVR